MRRLRQAPGAPSSNSAVSAWKKERKGAKLGALVGTSRALYTLIIGLVGKLKILKVLDQDTSWYFEVVISILCRCMIVLSFQSSTFDRFCLMSGMIFTLQPGLPFGFLAFLKELVQVARAAGSPGHGAWVPQILMQAAPMMSAPIMSAPQFGSISAGLPMGAIGSPYGYF